jgi:hypothetical protein
VVARGRGTIAHRWSAEQAGVHVVLILRSRWILKQVFSFNIGCYDLTVGIFLM